MRKIINSFWKSPFELSVKERLTLPVFFFQGWKKGGNGNWRRRRFEFPPSGGFFRELDVGAHFRAFPFSISTRAARFETLVCRSRKDNVSVSQAPQPAFEWTEKWEPPSRDNVLPLSRAISYSHEQATDQWMEWLESSFATCAFFNAPNRRPWFLSAGRLSFFCRSLFPRSRDHDERGLASFFLSNRDADIIRFASTTWCGRIVKIFVGKVTRDAKSF